jgi:beta-aspartyl-peptidase (threonine type)
VNWRREVKAQSQQLVAKTDSERQPTAVGKPDPSEADIRAVLDAQLRAWNAGDIDGFMQHYWQSDELTFSAGGQTTRSWQKTLQRYKERYPTRAAMGETTFKNLEITPLGAEAAMVLGEWQLRRAGETIGGNFTLVFRRVDGRWVIIHDHTSQSPAKAD